MYKNDLWALSVAAVPVRFDDDDKMIEMRFPVVGISHDGRDETVRKFANLNDTVFLKREPENNFDSNAVKVCLGGDVCIGYLSRQVASLMARDMDNGIQYDAFIDEIDAEIDYRIPDVWIKLTRRA